MLKSFPAGCFNPSGRCILLAVILLAFASGPVGSDDSINSRIISRGSAVHGGPGPELVVFFAGEVMGWTEPCGCPKNPAGGISRRAGYAKEFERAYPGTVQIWTDSGNFAGGRGEAGLRNTQTLHEAMRRLDYTAVNLGDRDVVFGFERLSDLAAEHDIPFVTANLVYQDDATPIAEPYRFKTVDLENEKGESREFRLGIIGLARMNVGLSYSTKDGRRIVTLDPVEAAPLLEQIESRLRAGQQ